MSVKSKLLDATGIANLLHTMGVAQDEVTKAAGIMTDLEIAKAPVSQSLTSGEEIKDRWTSGEGHKVPSSEQIKTGPTEHSSGGGAEKMIQDYSKPAPQHGIHVEAERLGAELGQIRGYMRSMTDMVRGLGKGHDALVGVVTALLSKSVEDSKEGLPGEAASFAAWHASKARQTLAAMKALLAKATQLKDGLDDIDDREARKACKAQIRDLRQRAARTGRDALALSYAAQSDEADPADDVRKTLHNIMDTDAVLKADISAFHDKDKDKDEEKRAKKTMKRMAQKAMKRIAKKAAKKAKKATGEVTVDEKAAAAAAAASAIDKGNQADKQDKETKNQDDSSTTKSELPPDAQAELTKALQGYGILEGKINDVFALLAGRPITDKAVTSRLELLKSGSADAMMDMNRHLDTAVSAGRLSSSGHMRAMDLLQKVSAVKAGAISQDQWDSMLAQSAPEVQEVWRVAA